ncbi:MAG TPA: VanZ family protein [Pyrinomonadaceae bacterium]|nr:VanZ family protein [Pyrinomonadaceae bacterium]
MIDEEALAATDIKSGTSQNRLWRYGPLIVWAALIFIGSSSILAGSNTSPFLVQPIRWLFPTASESTLQLVHLLIRKAGHLTEYAILAWLAARAFRTSSNELLHRRWFLVALILVVLYSLSDEFHQSFVPSRGASLLDCAIDSVGGLAALLLLAFRNRGVRSRKSPR